MDRMEGFTDGAVHATDEMVDSKAANDGLRNTIAFGMDVEIFLRSDIGKFLCACADAEIKDLRAEMDEVDACDSAAIRKLQLSIAARKIWKSWLDGALQEGLAARDVAVERNSL